MTVLMYQKCHFTLLLGLRLGLKLGFGVSDASY